jgi:hypothetical protein
VTNTNGTGETYVRNGGSLEINQVGGGTSSASTFTLLNEGTVNIGGATLNLTASGTQESDNGDASSGEINLQGGTLDADHRFNNNTGSTLDFGSGTFKAGFTFSNDGSIQRNSDATLDFDGTTGTTSLLGDFAKTNNNDLANITVRQDVEVDPGDALSEGGSGNPIVVEGKLTIESGGQFGEAISGGTFQEEADLEYNGTNFSVNGILYANKVKFASDETTTAQGSVFGEVVSSGTTTLVIGDDNFTVFGLVQVNTDATLDVADKQLVLNGDFLVDGTFNSNSGTVKFQGQGRETCCSPDGTTLDKTTGNSVQDVGGSASIDFGTLTVADPTNDGNTTADTDVRFLSAGSVTTVKGEFLVDEADLTTDRPLTLESDFTVDPDATFDLTGNNLLKFAAGNTQNVSLPEPLELNNVEVDKSGGNVNLNSNLIINNILRMSRGTLTPNARLSISERLTLNGGTIDVANGTGNAVLVSNASTDAFVEYVDDNENGGSGDGTVDGSVNGDLTYERFLDGVQNWYYMSSPAGNGTNDTFEEFLELGADNDLLTKGVTGADERENDSRFASVRLYDESEPGSINPSGEDIDAGWKPIDCTNFGDCVSGMSSEMQSGRGYAVYVYDNGTGFGKTINSDVEPFTSTSFDYSNSDGSAADGPGIQANPQTDGSIDTNDGWNLLSNPYFTTVDFCAFTRESGINPTVEVWDPQNGLDGQSTDGYATYNCDAGTGDGAGGGLDNGYLGPHQSFFVKANSESNLRLAIDDITTVQTNSTGFFRKSQESSRTQPPAVSLQFETDGMRYTSSVAFIEDGKTDLDNSDSHYIDGASGKSGLSFYSVLEDGTPLVTNVMPNAESITEETKIPFAVDGCNYGNALSGEATISRTLFRDVPADWGVVLEDTQTGRRVDLRAESTYTFTFSGTCPATTSKSAENDGLTTPPTPSVTTLADAKDGAPDTRFKLHIIPDAVIPVEITSFTGSVADNAAKLEWTTATEQNNAGFQVQQKVDGSFQNIEGAFVEGAGTSEEPQSYSYRVEDLDAGQHTFRLKQVDVDGGSSFSKETTVEIGLDSQYELKAYPNPISEQATIKFAVKESQDVTVELYNTLGQRVQVLHQGSVPSSQTRTVSLQASDLSSGLYIVRMRGESFSTTKSVTVVR